MGADEKEVIIKVNNLVQKTGSKMILDDVSFEVFAGECLGIFGNRATGKTALLHILAGVDRFTSGSVKVLGCDVTNSSSFKKNIGLVTQKRSLFQDLRAGENLDFIGSLKGVYGINIKEVVERLELEAYLKDPVKKLDIGVYQRLSLACAMLNSPKLLIVDNIIKDLDLYSRHIIIREMKNFLEQGGTCICGFSNMEFSSYMSRVGWLEDGHIRFFAPQEAIDRFNSLLEYYSQENSSGHV